MNQINKKFYFAFGLAFFWGLFFVFFVPAVIAANVDISATVPSPTPVCGNSLVEGTEQCDNSACAIGNCVSCVCVPPNGCTGGSTVCAWGACVAGNQTGSCTDGCSTWPANQSCTVPVCGNGTIESGEECDDSNTSPGDGCSATCQTELGCGNGVLDAGEECDDNNINSGDCCSLLCKRELIIFPVTEMPAITSATINWQTQCQSTASVLEWGKTIAVDEGSAAGLSGQNYSHNITNLAPQTIYFYKITATAGGLQTIFTGTFNTALANEICNNGIDDNLNGLIDLADPDCPCWAQYACAAWEPAICPANGVQTRTCDKTNGCWNDYPLPEVSQSCTPTCELSCGSCQVLDAVTCACNNLLPCCGNGSCELPDEDPYNCPGDCVVSCLSDWVCTPWEPEECPVNGIQTRTCYDNNACEVPINPPALEQTCGETCPGLSCGICQNINTTNCLCEELVPCCGNGFCQNGETYDNCPADCILPCDPEWSCSGWSECAGGTQTRVCTDLKNCNLNLGRPPEVTSCQPGCDVACGRCQQIDLDTCSCLNKIPCCGNRSCEEQENVWSCSVDCGLPPSVRMTLPQCLDGLDNDHDGQIDYPADTGCSSALDNSETDMNEMLRNASKQIAKFYKDKILDNPQVQTANQAVVAPILITTVAVNTVASVSLFNFLSYLRYIFSQPLAIVGRRRRSKWGTVYNSLTKQPIDLAIIRLYRKSDNRLIQSRVTDKLGRFLILAEPGTYYLTVTKPKFNFPSDYLKNKKEDVKFLDLYHGETVEVTEHKANITVNVPLDPIEDARPVKKIIYQYYLRKLQYAAAFSSVPLATISLIISPNRFTFSLLIFHVLLFILFRRLSYQRPPKSWGIIYDQDNKTPLARAITRIYDRQYNKLLETRITDNKGRYSFLVNNNVYYVTSEKAGYRPERTGDIDLVTTGREAIVNFDIGLKKANVMPPAGREIQSPTAPSISESGAVNLEPRIDDPDKAKIQAAVQQTSWPIGPVGTVEPTPAAELLPPPENSVSREELQQIMEKKINGHVSPRPLPPSPLTLAEEAKDILSCLEAPAVPPVPEAPVLPQTPVAPSQPPALEPEAEKKIEPKKSIF
jgi:cysteine-rich repeat protein